MLGGVIPAVRTAGPEKHRVGVGCGAARRAETKPDPAPKKRSHAIKSNALQPPLPSATLYRPCVAAVDRKRFAAAFGNTTRRCMILIDLIATAPAPTSRVEQALAPSTAASDRAHHQQPDATLRECPEHQRQLVANPREERVIPSLASQSCVIYSCQSRNEIWRWLPVPARRQPNRIEGRAARSRVASIAATLAG